MYTHCYISHDLFLQTIVKLQLVEPILQVLMPVMCEEADEDEEEMQFEGTEASTASSFAGQVCPLMSLSC